MDVDPLDRPGGAPAEIEVECYAGYKGEERPLRFRCGGDSFEVEEILERWYEPGKSCFLVRAAGAELVLRRNEVNGLWTGETARPRKGGAKPR